MSGTANESRTTNMPATNCKSFVPADDVPVTIEGGYQNKNEFPRAFIVDADGTLGIKTPAGDIVIITVIKGVIYPIQAKEYRAAGTTNVTAIVGLV